MEAGSNKRLQECLTEEFERVRRFLSMMDMTPAELKVSFTSLRPFTCVQLYCSLWELTVGIVIRNLGFFPSFETCSLYVYALWAAYLNSKSVSVNTACVQSYMSSNRNKYSMEEFKALWRHVNDS